MSKGNFKVRCIYKNNNPYYTEGKIYEVKDRTLIADDGHKIFTGLLWRFEDLQKFSGAEWELVKEYSGEYISIKRRKKRVVAVMSVDGQYKKSANVKLNDFDGDFEKAAKAVVGKLLEKKEDAPLTASTIDWEAFKQGKFAVHCDTEEKAKAFLKECDEQGIIWGGTQNSTKDHFFYSHKDKTCYKFDMELKGIMQRRLPIIDMPVIEYTVSKPAVKEVKRPAKVGEWIRVIQSPYSAVNDGEIKKVEVIYYDNVVGVKGNIKAAGDGFWAIDEYVVLENYQPESSSFDSNPEQEQPTSSTGMREVERFAKEGDIIEVLTGDGHRAEVGGIYKVLRPWDDYGWIEVQLSPEQDTDVLRYDQYVVLENYDYSLGHPKNEPFRKAKVGDKIKIVKVKASGHMCSCEIGEVQLVTYTDSDGVRVENENFYWDKDQEYIIIEEAPEEIQIGDTVKVVNNGKCYTRYEEWFVENAPQYLGKFAYGGMPKNGGSYKVLMKNDKDGLKYVIQEIDWPNDAVYLIDEKGIEKVR